MLCFVFVKFDESLRRSLERIGFACCVQAVVLRIQIQGCSGVAPLVAGMEWTASWPRILSMTATTTRRVEGGGTVAAQMPVAADAVLAVGARLVVVVVVVVVVVGLDQRDLGFTQRRLGKAGLHNGAGCLHNHHRANIGAYWHGQPACTRAFESE